MNRFEIHTHKEVGVERIRTKSKDDLCKLINDLRSNSAIDERIPYTNLWIMILSFNDES